MRKLLTFLFTLITIVGFSQGITVTVGDVAGKADTLIGTISGSQVIGGVSADNADSLGGEPPSFYVDTAINQNIHGLKVFKDDLVLDSTLSIGISTPDATAILDITSISKGLLYPRMTTTQRNAIGFPATGLSIYNTTNDDPNFFNGSAWRRITHAPGSSLKVGEVIFSTGVSALMGDSVNFFWDNTIKRLGIGMAAPTEKLEVNGNIKGDTNKIDVLKLNGISVDSIIPASSFTGNLGNSTTSVDTVFSAVFQSNTAVSSIRDSLVTKCECSNVADDGTIVLPDAITQSLIIWVDGDDEWALAAIQADGTVTLPVTVGSVVNTDTDANLCIYDSGTGATIKNRLGSSKVICYESKYKQ